MKHRIVALLAAAFASVLIATIPASAHDTDDWVRIHSADLEGWASRDADSTAGGVSQSTSIYWQGGGDVIVFGYVSDVATDGYCGAIQIRYQISESPGNWSHWHYRPLAPAYDCTTNGRGVGSDIWLSRYPTKDVQVRACHANSSGAILHCEGTWH